MDSTRTFAHAFMAAIGKAASTRKTAPYSRSNHIALARASTTLHDSMDPGVNYLFRAKSLLRPCREACWVPERIPDSEIHIPSLLAMRRISQTKKVKDPKTGKIVFEETELVKRYRDEGHGLERVMQLADGFGRLGSGSRAAPAAMLGAKPTTYKTTYGSDNKFNSVNQPGRYGFTNWEYFETLKTDIGGDVFLGHRPMTGISYPWITATFMNMFKVMEMKLKEVRNPTCVEAYERSRTIPGELGVSLTLLALKNEDPECLEIIAECFEGLNFAYAAFLYWDLDRELIELSNGEGLEGMTQEKYEEITSMGFGGSTI